MKSLSEAVIKTLAGEAAYLRGLDYYNEGQVQTLEVEGQHISATVVGQERYQVTLRHTAKVFDGSCNCPASDNFDFCKHCAAVSLAYYYQTQSNIEVADGARDDSVLLYLNTFTKPQLVDELWSLIKNEPRIYDHWQLRAEIAGGSLSSKDLRKRITQAIPYKPSGLWRPQEVANYFSDATSALKIIEPLLLSMDVRDGIKLVRYAVERLEKALETIDDRAAYRNELQQRLVSWFAQCLSSSQWQSKDRVNVLIEMVLSEKFDYEALNLPNGVINLISDQESEDLIRLIGEAWAKLPTPDKRLRDQNGLYHRLESILLEDARLVNDQARELEILAKGAVDTDRCLKLVRKCIDYQRLEEASKWLEYATQVQTLNSHEVSAIELHQIDLWLALGEFDQALAAQWSRFEESEEPADLRSVYLISEKIHQERAYLQQGIRYLNSKIEAHNTSPRNRQRVENLIEIYLSHNIVDDAISLASQHRVHPSILMAVCNAAPILSEKTSMLIERAVNSLVELNSKETNDRAAWFLKQLYAKAKERDLGVLSKVIKNIYDKPENKRRTSFVKQLKANFDFI